MKKIKLNIVLPFMILVLLQASCSKDFLNLSPEASADGDNFYGNEQEMRQAVSGAYNILQDLGRLHFWLYGEMRSDNTTFQYNTSDRGLESREFIDQFLVNATFEPIWQFWQQSYQGIARSNDVISRIDEIELDGEVRDQFLGEVRFLRALHYFNLVRQYGGVPLRLSPAESPEDAPSEGRASVEVIYEQLVEDLSSAADLLSGISHGTSDKGRATEGAARALLGKVYLTLQQYDLAIEQLRRVTQLGYALMPNYRDNFVPELKNGQESIFEIQYLGAQPALASDFMYQFAPFTSGSAVTGDPQTPLAGGAGWNIPTRDMIESYEQGDLRKDASMSEGYAGSDGQFVEIPYINKFNHGFVERGQTDVNFPVLRYADVLLMLAECLNAQGFTAGGEAFDLLNQVRIRAGLSPKTAGNAVVVLSVDDQEAFREAIFQERRVELAFENHRWYDLVRSGRAVEVMNAHGAREREGSATIPGNAYNVTENRLLLPIPQVEVNLDGLEQNPL